MRHTFIPPLTAIPFMEVHNSGSMYYHYHHVQPGYPKLEKIIYYLFPGTMFIQKFSNNCNILFFLSLNIHHFIVTISLVMQLNTPFFKDIQIKKKKPYDIFHSYSTTSHVLKALLNFPFFEDIPITKKKFIIYFVRTVQLLMYFKLYAKKCPCSI